MERLIAFEDEHLLAIRKPAGINTHASGPFAGEGIYDWLRHRDPRWADLAIIQRLDKETSGILLFSKTRLANVSLTKQFSLRRVRKEYALLVSSRPRESEFTVRSRIRKGHGRFESDASFEDGLEAETRFTVVGPEGPYWRLRAEPLTGRTHQIRLHAASEGLPILGDTLYGGAAAPRLCLHARSLRFQHPSTHEPVEWIDEPDFTRAVASALRDAVVDPSDTNACRLLHGAADGHAGWYIDRLGDYVLASTPQPLPATPPAWLGDLAGQTQAAGLYARSLDRHVRGSTKTEASPTLLFGAAAPEEFSIRENGLSYRMSFAEGYSAGLFLDQRDNRRRLQKNWIGAGFPVRAGTLVGAEVLNVFAYTCGFSVAAAAGGALTTSLDLSRKYLDWGRRNFAANDLDVSRHDFIYGDAFDWLRRLAKKGRTFDVVLLDPPTFSQSKEHGVFRAETGYGELVRHAARVLRPGGVLFASTNAARLEPELFLDQVRTALHESDRPIERELFIPQPPDFPTHRDEPGYLKTVWMRTRSRPGVAGGASPLTR